MGRSNHYDYVGGTFEHGEDDDERVVQVVV